MALGKETALRPLFFSPILSTCKMQSYRATDELWISETLVSSRGLMYERYLGAINKVLMMSQTLP